MARRSAAVRPKHPHKVDVYRKDFFARVASRSCLKPADLSVAARFQRRAPNYSWRQCEGRTTCFDGWRVARVPL
jgi:hypothetical protein